MRKIVAGLFVSLDGVAEAPETWHFPYFNDEMGAIVDSQMADSDTILLGRRTYEEFASFWPGQGSDVPMADEMNGARKVVVSTTLGEATWQNSTIVRNAAALAELKDLPGKDIAITGSLTLVRSLIRDGLLDELRLLVHPIVVGTGKRWFDGDLERTGLRLAGSEVLSTGVVYLTYTPAAAA